MKYLLILIAITGFAGLLHAQYHMAEAQQKVIEMPYFPGCGDLADFSDEKRNCSNLQLVQFIARNLEYPAGAQTAGIEGTIYVRFTVNARGTVEQIQLLNSIGGGCDEEALRVVNMMPAWEPAQSAKGATSAELDLPVQFTLKNAEPTFSENHTIHWGNLKSETATSRAIADNLSAKIIVRDKMGNALDVSNLTVAYQRNRTFKEAESTGSLTDDMKKILNRVKSGGELLITATVVEDGEFIEAARLWRIK